VAAVAEDIRRLEQKHKETNLSPIPTENAVIYDCCDWPASYEIFNSNQQNCDRRVLDAVNLAQAQRHGFNQQQQQQPSASNQYRRQGLNQARDLLILDPRGPQAPPLPILPLSSCPLLEEKMAHIHEATSGEPRLGPGFYQVSALFADHR